MGMAASQARYLALVARKSNCEYEGQQINQARMVLSNQTADLFNQMLGLSVPVPPSIQDFTKTQYSFTDGINKSTIESWQQLATPEEDFNYVVNFYHYSDVYTGSQKKMNDPQVQFSTSIPIDSTVYDAQVRTIEEALRNVNSAKEAYDTALGNYKVKLNEASKLPTYADNKSCTGVVDHSYDDATKNYTIDIQKKGEDDTKASYGYGLYVTTNATELPAREYYRKDDGKIYYDDGGTETEVPENKYGYLKPDSDPHTYIPYENITDANTKQAVADAIEQLKTYGALAEDFKAENVYYEEASKRISFKQDIDELLSTGGTGTRTILNSYYVSDPDDKPEDATYKSIHGMVNEVNNLKSLVDAAKSTLDLAEAIYDTLSVPSYIGNCQLTPISELTKDEMAEIKQIITDMKDQDVNTYLTRCFDTLDGTYSPETYKGGIYSFKLNGIKYYTTYYDLAQTAAQGEGINNIDNQPKLAYYNATYVPTKIEQTEKAMLQTDGSGRFTSIRIGDDTITYALNVETVSDDVAYQDAMNQYYYENAKYDKMIQDINAKTSLIQQEDQQLELRLKQLDTEQNALSNEIEAVSKVVKDNVEKSFKTFGG